MRNAITALIKKKKTETKTKTKQNPKNTQILIHVSYENNCIPIFLCVADSC